MDTSATKPYTQGVPVRYSPEDPVLGYAYTEEQALLLLNDCCRGLEVVVTSKIVNGSWCAGVIMEKSGCQVVQPVEAELNGPLTVHIKMKATKELYDRMAHYRKAHKLTLDQLSRLALQYYLSTHT